MFIQVITGTTSDPEGLRRQGERFEREVRPGAVGFLGSTAGITATGRFVAVARFASEDAARRNSARLEQSNWWAETEKYLDSPMVQDSSDVITLLGGGSNDAGFVQVMRGHVLDPAKMAEIRSRQAEFEAAMSRLRPDVIGDVIAMHPDGTYTDVVYFTSEAAAREGENRAIPVEFQSLFEGLMKAIAVDEYLDLKDPELR